MAKVVTIQVPSSHTERVAAAIAEFEARLKAHGLEPLVLGYTLNLPEDAPQPTAPDYPHEGCWRAFIDTECEDVIRYIDLGTTLFKFESDQNRVLIRVIGDWVFFAHGWVREVGGMSPSGKPRTQLNFTFGDLPLADFRDGFLREMKFTADDIGGRNVERQLWRLFHFGNVEGWLKPYYGLTWEAVVLYMAWDGYMPPDASIHHPSKRR